jgi:hypothetical protein
LIVLEGGAFGWLNVAFAHCCSGGHLESASGMNLGCSFWAVEIVDLYRSYTLVGSDKVRSQILCGHETPFSEGLRYDHARGWLAATATSGRICSND